MPDLENYGPAKVAPEPRAAVKVDTQMPAEAAGGGASRAQGAEAGAGVATELGQYEAMHEYAANQVIQQDAENNAAKALNDAVYGVMDEKGNVVKPGLKQFTGDKVLTLGQPNNDLQAGLSKQLDAIQASMPNERVQANFERTKREVLDRFDNEKRPWVVRQLDEHDKAVTGQAINTYTMDGMLNASKAFAPGTIRLTGPDGKPVGKPLNAVDLAAAKLTHVILDAAGRRGLDASDPEVQNQLHQAMGQFHQGVISQMLQAKRPEMAEKYFKEHEVEMMAKHVEGVESGIAKVYTHVEAEDLAQKALAGSETLGDSLAKIAEAGGDEDVQRRAAALVRQGFAQKKEMEDSVQQRAIADAEAKRGGKNEPIENYLDPTLELTPKNAAAVKFLNAPSHPPKSDKSALRDFIKTQTGSGWFGTHENGLKNMDRSTLLTKYISKVTPATAKYMMAAWKESQNAGEPGSGLAGTQLSQHADSLDAIEKNSPPSSVNPEDAYYQHPAVVAADKDNRLLTSDEQKQAVKDTTLKTFKAGPPAPAADNKETPKWMDLSVEYRKTMESLPGLAGKVLSPEQKDLLARAYHATKQGDTKAAKQFYESARDWVGKPGGAGRTF